MSLCVYVCVIIYPKIEWVREGKRGRETEMQTDSHFTWFVVTSWAHTLNLYFSFIPFISSFDPNDSLWLCLFLYLDVHVGVLKKTIQVQKQLITKMIIYSNKWNEVWNLLSIWLAKMNGRHTHTWTRTRINNRTRDRSSRLCKLCHHINIHNFLVSPSGAINIHKSPI